MAELPWWRADQLARRLPHLAARDRIVQNIRRMFTDANFVEVETPALQVSPGLEPHLKAFSTWLETDTGEKLRRHLHTSPEFAMKKLLVAGVPRLFQMSRVFRNGERSRTHHPEFTMLEWYRSNAAYYEIAADCEALLKVALQAAGTEAFTWEGRRADPNAKWSYISVVDAFRLHAGIDLLATTPDPEKPDLGRLADQSRKIGIAPHEGDTWEDLFFRVFLDRIEPKLGIGAPTILHDYPLSMAALARPKPEDPRLAERFELYVCGLELANAFGELTDPAEQRRRFERDRLKRQSLYGEAYPVDEDFLAALAHGLPPSAGIALGLDRLVMLATGAPRIEDVLWAPVA